MNIPINILALVFVLSFLIFFHEGGHFVIAKLFRFPVEVFSLGFGKRLFGFKQKETYYRVSAIPAHFFIDKDGVLRQIWQGSVSETSIEASLKGLVAP